ncbi:MAG: hypothetical protein IKE43_02865 [Coriobacteriales bacterium]|nr:hypothetical protein [Coriobacteriales bacterium]
MPILMNKGDNPHNATWLLFSAKNTLDEFEKALFENRVESGVLWVDPQQIEDAKKASSEVDVYLIAETLVPPEVDLEAARGEVIQKSSQAYAEALEQKEALETDEAEYVEQEEAEESRSGVFENDVAEKDSKTFDTDDAETSADLLGIDDVVTDSGEADDDSELSDSSSNQPDYEPIPASERICIPIGTTTRLAAENYLVERDLGENGTWRPEMPGLQMLSQLICLMREAPQGLPNAVIWHVDADGIMRMSPAKQVKAMAGNTLRAKL